ncbi:hypothetical protein HHK36_000315 [Tetracentron sinense]|uniref:Uncharacterized protein n=1 Tax=Tetracentron sinense TaxID=13715 RepID=A0A835DQV7_TETSI|nr:hypothetical protein HHK36_000315 [Tetracentron sinense]
MVKMIVVLPNVAHCICDKCSPVEVSSAQNARCAAKCSSVSLCLPVTYFVFPSQPDRSAYQNSTDGDDEGSLRGERSGNVELGEKGIYKREGEQEVDGIVHEFSVRGSPEAVMKEIERVLNGCQNLIMVLLILSNVAANGGPKSSNIIWDRMVVAKSSPRSIQAQLDGSSG